MTKAVKKPVEKVEPRVFDMFEVTHLVLPRAGLSDKELDGYFPDRIILTANQNRKLSNISKERFDSYCTGSMECCVGMGDSDGVNQLCRYAMSGKCYKPEGLETNCPDVKMWIRKGIFPWVASRTCGYWDLFEEVTNTRWDNREC